jgi:hypothetical protein
LNRIEYDLESDDEKKTRLLMCSIAAKCFVKILINQSKYVHKFKNPDRLSGVFLSLNVLPYNNNFDEKTMIIIERCVEQYCIKKLTTKHYLCLSKDYTIERELIECLSSLNSQEMINKIAKTLPNKFILKITHNNVIACGKRIISIKEIDEL